MAKILEITDYDVIKIVQIDFYNKYLYEAYSIKNYTASLPVEEFLFSKMDKLLASLSESKKAIILVEQHIDSVDNSELGIMKYNTDFWTEIYVPFFDLDSTTAGFIYLTKIKYSDMIIETNLEYLNALKLLLHIIEQKIANVKLTENLYDTVLLLCEIVNAKQPYMVGNLYTIYNWAKKIADMMNLSSYDILKLQLAILMHDLGKIYIDEHLLNKTGKYAKDDYEIIKTRIKYSYDISAKINNMYEIDDVPNIILNCQERIDGTGYPNGTVGNNIPLLSKILHISMAVAAMLSNTLYRKAMTINSIIQELNNNSGTQFDSEISRIATTLLLYKKDELSDLFSGIGNYVTLSVISQSCDDLNIWGSIRKVRNFYEFIPSEALPEIKTSQIKSCYLYMNVDERILKFKPEIKNISSNKLTITRLISQNEEKALSINWVTDGSITTKNKTKLDIHITSIGGDYLDFYLFKDYLSEPLTSGIISIDLTDKDVSYLPGVIIFQQSIFDKIYFRFEYRNINESEQKKVFSSIFKKQLELKRSLTYKGHSV